MTKEEKIAWLRGYRTAALEVERLRGEIERWRSLAEKVTPTLSGLPRGSVEGSRTEISIEKINGYCARLADTLTVLVERCAAIERAIRSVPDERLRLLLQYRYIDGMRFESVAAWLKLSVKWTRQLHDRAIEQIKICGTS